jgi:hypothetical protein
VAYAILRAKKLKTAGSVAAALQHNFRERETPNADVQRTPENEHQHSVSTDQAMGLLRTRLPATHRKDAVLVVEYVMTASPTWFERATPELQHAFFERSRAWLRDKYGAENVIAATVQRDEKTPHLSAFVVPRTPDGRLSAKEFIGNRDKMRADQTSFAELVRDLGLERGIPGSRATHQRVAQHYAQISRTEPLPTLTEADLVPRKSPAPGLLGALRLQSLVETPDGVAARLTASVRQATAPLAAKAATAVQERRRADEMARTAQATSKALKTAQEALQKAQATARQILELIVQGGPELEVLRQRARDALEHDRSAKQAKTEPQQVRSRGRTR